MLKSSPYFCWLNIFVVLLYTDLIGHVVEVSHVEMISVNGKDTIIKRLILYNKIIKLF